RSRVMFRPRLTRRAVVIAVFVLVALIAFSRSRSRAGVFAGNASFDRVASVAGFAGAARSVDSFAPAPAVSVAAAPPAAAPAEAKSETFAPIFPTAQLVRTADLRIEVRDVATTLREADRVARSRGGLLADGHLNHAAEGPAEAQVTIRVP